MYGPTCSRYQQRRNNVSPPNRRARASSTGSERDTLNPIPGADEALRGQTSTLTPGVAETPNGRLLDVSLVDSGKQRSTAQRSVARLSDFAMSEAAEPEQEGEEHDGEESPQQQVESYQPEAKQERTSWKCPLCKDVVLVSRGKYH